MILTIFQGDTEVVAPYKVKVLSTSMNLHNVDYANMVVVTRTKKTLSICNPCPGDLVITCKKLRWWQF